MVYKAEGGRRPARRLHRRFVMSDDNQVTELTELTDLITSSNGARILKRDNVLIKAVYNATALETKIFLRALYDAQQTNLFTFDYSTKEIAEIIGLPVNSHVYEALHSATKNMVSNTIYIWDGRKNPLRHLRSSPTADMMEGYSPYS